MVDVCFLRMSLIMLLRFACVVVKKQLLLSKYFFGKEGIGPKNEYFV